MNWEQFSKIFALLAIQLRATDADEATARAYFAGLKDLEPEFVAMAAEKLARTAEWFPKTSEWRAACATVARERTELQRTLLRNLREPLCLACADTGWEQVGAGVKPCACLRQRRLEVLGRRPWPALPSAPEPMDADPERVAAMIAPLVEKARW